MARKILHYILILSFTLACASCESEDDYGYPAKIYMSGQGETKSLTGNKDYPPYIGNIAILDYDGNGNSGRADEESESFTVTTQWLTVESSLTENRLTLTAEPNSTKKKRKLYLYLYCGNTRQEITVIQKAK